MYCRSSRRCRWGKSLTWRAGRVKLSVLYARRRARLVRPQRSSRLQPSQRQPPPTRFLLPAAQLLSKHHPVRDAHLPHLPAPRPPLARHDHARRCLSTIPSTSTPTVLAASSATPFLLVTLAPQWVFGSTPLHLRRALLASSPPPSHEELRKLSRSSRSSTSATLKTFSMSILSTSVRRWWISFPQHRRALAWVPTTPGLHPLPISSYTLFVPPVSPWLQV